MEQLEVLVPTSYTPTRIQIKLMPEESRLLAVVARRERRDPRQQAAVLIRQALGLDGKVVKLSPISEAVLTQVAKDEGLDSIDAALEHVVMANAVPHPNLASSGDLEVAPG